MQPEVKQVNLHFGLLWYVMMNQIPVCTRLIEVVCSMTKQVPVCMRLIADDPRI